MKGPTIIGLVSVVIIFSALFCWLGINSVYAADSFQFTESQLTTNASDQQNPDIYEYGYNNYAVVWQDNRNGNWDIYMYYQNYTGRGDWDVQPDIRITSNSSNNLSPKIYNDTILYQSNRNGNWDIFMYNITSKVETQITNNTANQQFPEVYGNTIVWQDYRDSSVDIVGYVTGLDIYTYNLTSHTEQRLPSTEQNAYNPAISRDYVVYAAENYTRFPRDYLVYPYVCSYNLSNGLKYTLGASSQTWRGGIGISSLGSIPIDSVAVDGSFVAWSDSGGGVIVATNVSTGSVWYSPSGWHGNPDVSGSFVVFQTYYNGYWHVNLYDHSRVILNQVISVPGHQQNPAISAKYGNFIVYQDDRSGHWHIYLTAFNYAGAALTGSNPPATSITPSANTTGSGNQDLTIITIIAVVVVVAVVGAAAFGVTRRRKLKAKQMVNIAN